ncbi:hypothetical protein C7441_108135 [Pseudaminobacter salicylatoxidans]|uniref:Lipoprotein n=1 Tax=Pseudaminobacter salicylatoxidans TaxID=93369 RepID=A0A316C290_PSESE|nr:hypothetical protein [Pseudaminobacter salicylatoxidans]PWJ83741.1 hypothetical protein C7441_108135 [Pseudaminobacter salicylatoxidans]
MIGLFGALLLTGCSAEAEAPTSKNSTGVAISVLETTTGRYEFTPTTCGIYSQDDFDDIEIQGPGTAPNGEKFFFQLSSTANAMTIGLGVDRPFASPERQIQAGRVYSQEFTIVTSGRQLSVAGLVLVDENGASIDDRATLTIDCGAQ